MDGERDLSTLGGQQLAHMHPFRGDCLLSSGKKAVAWPPRVPNFVTAKGVKWMYGRLLTLSEYFSNLVLARRIERRETGG
jgi:hypothetical protein